MAPQIPHSHPHSLQVSGKVTKIALEANISVHARRETEHIFKTMTQRAKDHFVKDDQYINGVPGTPFPVLCGMRHLLVLMQIRDCMPWLIYCVPYNLHVLF